MASTRKRVLKRSDAGDEAVGGAGLNGIDPKEGTETGGGGLDGGGAGGLNGIDPKEGTETLSRAPVAVAPFSLNGIDPKEGTETQMPHHPPHVQRRLNGIDPKEGTETLRAGAAGQRDAGVSMASTRKRVLKHFRALLQTDGDDVSQWHRPERGY